MPRLFHTEVAPKGSQVTVKFKLFAGHHRGELLKDKEHV